MFQNILFLELIISQSKYWDIAWNACKFDFQFHCRFFQTRFVTWILKPNTNHFLLSSVVSIPPSLIILLVSRKQLSAGAGWTAQWILPPPPFMLSGWLSGPHVPPTCLHSAHLAQLSAVQHLPKDSHQLGGIQQIQSAPSFFNQATPVLCQSVKYGHPSAWDKQWISVKTRCCFNRTAWS